MPFPGHLEHKVRPPASLEQKVRSGRLLGKGSAFRSPGLTRRGLFRNLRMLKELRADSKLSTDSHEAWPKAEPSHVPLNEGARRGERGLTLPPSMDIVQGPGRSLRSRGKGSCRQGWELRILGRAAQAGRNRLRQVHVDRA